MITVERDEDRCWVLTGVPIERDDDWGACYPTEQAASLVAADERAAGHVGAGHAKRDHACHYADCDGCGVPLEGEWVVHAPDREALQEEMDALAWVTTDDGRVLCDDCAEHPIRGGTRASRGSMPIPGNVPLFDLAEVPA